MSDNNHFGVALVMALPVLLYLYQYSKWRLVRYGFLGVLGATVLAIVGSNSRGAFLAMAVFAGMLVLASRRKVMASAVVLIGVVLVLVLSPARWFERIETIGHAGQDSSFMGRVDAWNIASALALRNPVFGTGFHAMLSPEVWHSVRPSEGLLSAVAPPVQQMSARAAHSIYFEILGDLGFVGLFLFLAILGNALLTVRQVKRIATRDGPSMLWARDMADTLGLACVVFAVGGAGVSLAYFETFYLIVVLIEVLKQTVVRMSKESAQPVLIGSEAPSGGPMLRP